MTIETFDVDDLTLWPDEGDGKGQGQPGEGQPGDGKGKPQPGDPSKDKGKGKKSITQDDITKDLDGRADHHDAGQQEGKKTDIKAATKGRPLGPKDIDENHKRVKDDMKKSDESEGTSSQERRKWQPEEDPDPERGEGSRGGDAPVDGIDYSKIKPSVTWKQLVKKFVMSGAPKEDESWSRQERRSASAAMTSMKQTGAGAVKPATMLRENDVLKLAIGIDTSGSMMSTIPKVYAEVNALMKRTEFKGKAIYVFKFGTTYEIYECFISKNEAYRVSLTDGKRLPNAKTTCTAVFETGMGGGTEITQAGANELMVLLGKGYNIVFLTDSDMSWSHNIGIMKQLLVKGGRRMFLLLRSRSEYVSFVRNAKFETKQMSYIDEK